MGDVGRQTQFTNSEAMPANRRVATALGLCRVQPIDAAISSVAFIIKGGSN